MGIQNNLNFCDSYHLTLSGNFMAQRVQGFFLGFDFCPHSIIPVRSVRDVQTLTLFKTKIVHVAHDPHLARFAHSNFRTNIIELDFQFKTNLSVPHMRITRLKAFLSERHLANT